MQHRFKLALICLLITSFSILSNSDTTSIKDDMNRYYQRIDESFTRLCKSSVFKNTGLSAAEKLFVREMKKNQSYYCMIRVNSKGKIISEAVRGKKVERPNTDVEREKWFQAVKKDKEPFYTMIRDDDRGRYYLIWCKPVLKNNTFVGAVVAKIDLWDSFYEFSNVIYYPFLIRLNGMRLFSHKWNNGYTYKEDRLTIPGINRISVRYIPEKNTVAASVSDSTEPVSMIDTVDKKDTVAGVSVSKASVDIIKTDKPQKNNFSLLIFMIVSLALTGGAVTLFVVISGKRKKEFLKKLDEE